MWALLNVGHCIFKISSLWQTFHRGIIATFRWGNWGLDSLRSCEKTSSWQIMGLGCEAGSNPKDCAVSVALVRLNLYREISIWSEMKVFGSWEKNNNGTFLWKCCSIFLVAAITGKMIVMSKNDGSFVKTGEELRNWGNHLWSRYGWFKTGFTLGS